MTPRRFAAVVAALIATHPATAAVVGDTVAAPAARVVDGDTLYLDGIPVRFRLWGIDAPEADDPGYGEARAALIAMTAGHRITCRVRDIDQHGRPVAACALPDGRDIGRALVRAGLACDYARFSGQAYRADQDAARRTGAGLWRGGPPPSRWPGRCNL